jgi:integrase
MEALKRCGDYLRIMVIVSLNTGARRGALFSLLWSDVDLDMKILTLRGEDEKNSKMNYVPINHVAFAAFMEWRRVSKGDLVFPSPRTGNRLTECRHAWHSLMKAAQIENFRWHDMRHDFASQLVMKGVDLNTVRELLGHADMKMTLRYAHLAPEAKVRAVGVLD